MTAAGRMSVSQQRHDCRWKSDFSAGGPRRASGGWWLHDLRRMLATGLQRLGVRLEVTEAVLNHPSGSRAGVVGTYQRHDWAEEKSAGLRLERRDAAGASG
jgi:hypothetical protein